MYMPVLYFEYNHIFPSVYRLLYITGKTSGISVSSYLTSLNAHILQFIRTLLNSEPNYTLLLMFVPFMLLIIHTIRSIILSSRYAVIFLLMLGLGFLMTGFNQGVVASHR